MNRNAPVAQLDRALPSEGKGHTFESCRVRQHGAAWPAGLLAAVVLIQHLFACSQTALAAEAPAPIPEKLRLLTRFFEDEVSSGKLPGAIVLIQQHGQPVYLRTFGVRDVKTSEAMTVDTRFALLSMTKPITSFAAMMLSRNIFRHSPIGRSVSSE